MKMNKLRIGGVLFTEVSLFRAIGTFTLLGLLILITSCSTNRWRYYSGTLSDGIEYHEACGDQHHRDYISGIGYYGPLACQSSLSFTDTTISVICYPADVLEDVRISIIYRYEYDYDGVEHDVRYGLVINPWAEDSAGRERAYHAYSGTGARAIIDEQSNVFNLLGYKIDDEPVQLVSLPIDAFSVDPGEPIRATYNDEVVFYPTYRFQLNNMEGTNFLKSLMGKGSELYIRWYPDNAEDISTSGFSLSRSSATIRKTLDRCGVNIEDL